MHPGNLNERPRSKGRAANRPNNTAPADSGACPKTLDGDGPVTEVWPPFQCWLTPWHLAAARLLGLPPRRYFGADFIDNLVTWRPAVARALTERIAAATGLDWRVTLARSPSFSEYVLYGVFCDQILGADSGHVARRDSLCHTQWGERSDASAVDAFIAGIAPHHVACSVQSTSGAPIVTRRAVLDRCIAKAGRQDAALARSA